jgi:hypothetical protein
MLVGKSQNPEGLIASIARMIKKDYFVGRGRMAYPFRTKLWDTNQLGFDMISFLNVFAEIYPNKKSAEVKQAKNLLSSIDDVLAHYYDIV